MTIISAAVIFIPGSALAFFFLLVIFGAGIAFTGSFIIQHHFANKDVHSRVVVREAILFGTYLALLVCCSQDAF